MSLICSSVYSAVRSSVRATLLNNMCWSRSFRGNLDRRWRRQKSTRRFLNSTQVMSLVALPFGKLRKSLLHVAPGVASL